METLIVLVVIILGFVGLYGLMWSVRSKNQPQELETLINQVFGMSAAKIAEQSRQLLASEKETIKVDLANKQHVIEELVKQLQNDMKTRQEEIRLLEQDRVKKFGELSTSLEQHRLLAEQVRVSTQQLANVLSNNQQRGEWGERIIEDLMQANGLVEGVHYLRQSKQTTGTLRPDITLLLPNERIVAVDVKFPYAEIQKMAIADSKAAQQAHLKQFGIDLKTKITKVTEYINPAEQTLDYAILFVPNEMIFSFINQKFPDLVDEAIAKRVLIVSPFTFLIVARTVIESYRNFMIGDKLKDVVRYVDEFVKEWSAFKLKFEKYGRSIDTLKTDFDELTGTRFRQMEKKITKIETYRQGGILTKKGEANPTLFDGEDEG